MASFVTSNVCDEQALDDWKVRLDDSSHFLSIFSNDFTPVPGNVLADFDEATFDGYAQVDTTGHWGAIVKILNGLYQMDSDEFVFTGATLANQTCYGWYVHDDTDVKFSKRFAAPILFLPGVVIKIILSPQVFSVSILE